MSDTLISQQLSLPMMSENQLNPAGSKADLSTTTILEGSMEPLSTNPTTDHLPLSSMEHHPQNSTPTFSTMVGQDMWASHNLNRLSESTAHNLGVQQCRMPGRETRQTQLIKSGSLVSNLSMPIKRKATTELMPDYRGAEKMPAPNGRAGQVGSFAKASNAMSPSMSNSVISGAFGRKVVQLESVKSKPNLAASKKNSQPKLPSKTSKDSNDSVRAKLRESLTSALALVSQERESTSDEKKKTGNEATTAAGKEVEEKPLVSESSTSANVVAGKPEGPCSSSASCPTSEGSNVNNVSQGIQSNETSGEPVQSWNYIGTNFQSNPVLSGEDVSFGDGFFFRDELLQGNGLTWEMELPPIPEEKKVEHNENPEMVSEEVSSHEKEQATQSPEAIAFKIEEELYKLFGGVNKKYKEKGRSLLFNLKDRNNPELRERVMSGEITPERLCSMTAEELASKELSQWRIAKAEELDHMKVLPDSEANMRRLVKKTHKGEYTVYLDPNLDAMEEIPSGASAPLQSRSKTKSTGAGAPRKVEQKKADQANQCEITIPVDGADMQGLMVDDVRDLPPIVSLDEFMESLDKEPPFENLPVGSSHESDKENPSGSSQESKKEELELGSESLSSVEGSKHHVETKSHKTDDVVMDTVKQTDGVRSTTAQKGTDATTIAQMPKGERVWEGLLQISLSSMTNFVAFFISGEKANTKEWPSYFEIKGRVKLDAFDKFVQALPMSRSRAMMVTHFTLKEGSTESDRANLLEVVDSYMTDQRLGFAEPASGVELYLCPPRSKSVDVITAHLSKSYTENLKDIDIGLIGLLVWRKVQITPAISPHSSFHHHKDMSKKNPFSTSGVHHQNPDTDMTTNRNYGFPSRLDHPSKPQPFPSGGGFRGRGDDNDDDVPPGFGPPGQARDDDDLPEFNFSSGSSNPAPSRLPNPKPFLSSRDRDLGPRHHLPPPQTPSRQVEQMRELIQKYGQNGNTSSRNSSGSSIPTQPWNDDDDDIPEWQPQAPPPPPAGPGLTPRQQLLPFGQPMGQLPPIQPLQPPMRVPQQGTWWPYGPPNNSVGNQGSDQYNRGRPGGRGF